MSEQSIQRDIDALRRLAAEGVLYKYFARDGDRIRAAVDAMIKTMGRKPGKQEFQLVDYASNRVLDVVVYWPLDAYLRDFSTAFSRVLRAWAMSCGCDVLRIRADAIERVIMQHLTILDAIAVMRKLLRRIEPLAKYTPPSFQLARHYLETILKKYERNEPVNIYEQRKRETENQSGEDTTTSPERGSK